jgi:uncharacterized protein
VSLRPNFSDVNVLTATMTTLRCNVADLLHHPGSRRTVHLEAPASELGGVGGSRVADRPLAVDVTLERVPDGVVVRGRVAGEYMAQCSRCLAPITRELSESVDELYEPDPVEGETYRLDGDELDLEPAVRDAILLDLPVAPLCREDCAGLCPVCGTDRNVAPCTCDTSFPDPRWDALRALTFDN